MKAFGTTCLALVFSAGLASAASGALVNSGLQVHLDASQITGLSSGDPVSTWADQSGNGRSATASDANRPTYITNAMNGLPVVRFNGTNALLSSFPSNTFSVDGTTLFAVFRVQPAATAQYTLTSLHGTSGAGTPAGVNQAFMFVSRYATGDLFSSLDGTSGDNTASQNLDGPYNDGLPHLFVSRSNAGTGSSSNIFQRADGKDEITYSDAAQQSAVNLYTVGALNNGTSNRLVGDLAEILVYNRPLTTTEIAENEAHLMQKYAIPEPSSMALAATGLGLMLLRRRRASGV